MPLGRKLKLVRFLAPLVVAEGAGVPVLVAVSADEVVLGFWSRTLVVIAFLGQAAPFGCVGVVPDLVLVFPRVVGTGFVVGVGAGGGSAAAVAPRALESVGAGGGDEEEKRCGVEEGAERDHFDCSTFLWAFSGVDKLVRRPSSGETD